MISPASLWATASFAARAKGWQAQRLQELSMPLLAIVGEHDIPDFVQVTDQLCRHVPQAQKLVVSGVGHVANMEAPELVTEAIVAFLRAL